MEIVYFDVDGIILDFTGEFAKYWNEGLTAGKWSGPVLSDNPTTWSFGFRKGIDDMTVFDSIMDLFHESHDHLPLMHPEIGDILGKLRGKYHIELVSSYPNRDKRLGNLLHHAIPYDTLHCGIKNKLHHIQQSEEQGNTVVAIFEDGPHHLDRYLPHYPHKIWAPRYWNYLAPYSVFPQIYFYDHPQEWLQLLSEKK